MTGRSIRWLFLLAGLTIVNGQTDLANQIRDAQSSGDYARAARLYKQLIAQGIDTPEIRSNYGVMLHLAGENQEALRELELALHRNPSLGSASLFAGLSAFDLREYRKALSYLVRARNLAPHDSAPRLALAKTYLAIRDYRSANDAYRKAAQIDPNSAEAWFGIGVTDRAAADELLNQAAHRGNSINNSLHSEVQTRLHDALDSLAKALALDPGSARAHLLLAETLSDQGNLADSVTEYEKALELEPDMEGARLGLATTYWKNRQFDQALPLLNRLLSQNSADAEANGIMADIAEHQGQNASAKKYAQAALSRNPDLIQTRVVLARIYLAENQPRLAVTELKKVASADIDGSYHFLLYRAYHLAGDEIAAQAALGEYRRQHDSSVH